MATNRPKQTKNKLLIFARTYISAGAVLLWTISIFSFPAEAAINEKINYQGKLTDSNSIIVPDGAYDMVFALYTAPSGGSAIWTESWTSAALWSESSSTTVTRNAAPCGGSGFTSIVYSTGTNESSLATGQYIWNTTLKESAAITSVDTGTNTICTSNPYSSWANGDDLTNRVYLKSGLFSTMLGSVTSLSSVNFSQTLYLGLTVGTDGEMAPRKVLGAVPSALTAKTLNNNESATLATAAGATLNIGNTTGGITMNSGGTSTWTNTAGGLTISTATSGTLALNSAGALNLTSAAASTVTLANVMDSLNFDSNTLSIDALNNRIGIGTNAPSAALELAASTVSAASLQINSGTAPTVPNDGDVWYDGTHLYFHNNTTDRDLLAGGGYSTIIDESTSLTQRSSLAFLGAGVTCQDNNGQTECTISAGGAGPWTDGTGISYLTDAAEDFAVGGSTLASPFSVDVSNSIVRIGLGSGSYNGTLAMYGSDGDTGNLSYTTNDAWDFEGGNVGIGTANPNSLLDIYSSSADSVLTLSAASATYNPLMKFRTGASPSVQFSMGVDTSDSNKFKIYSGDGIDGTSEFEMDTNGVTSIASLKLGAQSFAADAGAVSWIDMPVTSSASAGTEESYTAQLDGNAMLTIYGTSDGSGGTTNRSVRLSAPLGFLESTGATYYTYFQGGDQSADITYTLPTTNTTGILHNSSGTLSWSAINLAGADVTGTLAVANGGTGTATAPTAGQLLVGNSSGGYNLATLTQGSNISITSASGSITIGTSATPSFTTVNGLTLTSATDGFTIAGGTTPRTLTITGANVAINQNLQTTNSPTFAGLTLNGNIAVRESDGATYYSTFQGGDQNANLTYTLPTAYPATSGYVLSSTDAGVMSWVAQSGGMTNPMTAAGDLIYGGTSGAPTRLAGSGTNGWVLAYNTSTNEPYWTAMTGGGGTLQNAYDYTSGNTILTTTGRNIAFTLGEVATPTSFTLENQDTAGTNAEYINNSIASGTLANGLTIENTAGGTMTNAINILETAGAITTGINIGNNVGTGISIGTGVTTGISVGSGGITIAAGALAVNSDSITSDGATLTINATGTVDVQDILNADSITSDAGVSIAAGSSYTGAGAVTLSSASASGLTIDSGTTGTLAIGTDSSAEAINFGTGSADKDITIGSTTSGSTIKIQSGSESGITIEANGTSTGNVQIGDGGTSSATPDLLVLDTGSAEPTGTVGAMYYSTALNKFRCYQNTGWTDCIGSGTGGSPAGSNTQIQYNNSGSFGADAGLTFDSSTQTLGLDGTDAEINMTGITNEPSAPSSGTMNLYAKSIGGRMMPKWQGPSGLDTPIQPFMGTNKIGLWNPAGNATTVPGVFGFTAFTASGTATARNVATTNLFTRTRRIGYVYSTAGTNVVGGARVAVAQYTVGNGSGLGGFFLNSTFGQSDTVTTARMFVGMSSTTAAPTTVEPSTLTNSIGVGCGAADTNLKIFYGGSAAQTPIDLGTNFPCNTSSGSQDLYELTLFAPTNVNNVVNYRVRRLGTSYEASGTLTAATPGTQLPSSSTLLAWRGWRATSGTSGSPGIDLVNIYIETDY